MGLVELLLIAIGLSMDAFAVAICKGLSMAKTSLKKSFTVGLYFGIFQGLMPLLGYLIGAQFADKITAFDHWIAFLLLGVIGAKMIKESREKGAKPFEEASLKPSKMLPLAIATSIDALAIGISFAFLDVNIITATTTIAVTTLILSMAGVKIGNIFGVKYKSRAELAGGIILVLMGIKILLDHTGFI